MAKGIPRKQRLAAAGALSGQARSDGQASGSWGCWRMRNLVTMREALRRAEYFGDALAGDSWANWRVLLIAIAGEELDEAEAEAFKALSGRTVAPTEAAREVW